MTRDPLSPIRSLTPDEQAQARSRAMTYDDLVARVLALIDRGDLDAEAVLAVCRRTRMEAMP